MRECLSNALGAWSTGDYQTALREYLKNLIMSTEQERMDKYQEQFANLLAQASKVGIFFSDRNKQLQDILYPKSPLVLWTLGNSVMPADPFEALTVYEKAALLSGGLDLINIIGSMAACRSTIVSTWHIKMVNDKERNALFEAALSRIVAPNSKVLDIGSGSGILSMLASRYSFHTVIGLEGELPMALLGQRCVERNLLGPRVVIQPVMSSQYVPLPDQIPDVVVSETMDAGGLGEKILEIFYDARMRYSGGDPTHQITFCPSKLTFFIVLIESDKFWRSRMHAHNCLEFGCDATCWLSEHTNTLLSDHSMHRGIEVSYTTMDPDDFDDVIFLNERVEICNTPLDNEQFVTNLHLLRHSSDTFTLPITRAGRADAALLCWSATLSPGIELESVRKGGWDYAAYPLQARTQYQPGDTFHGEWVVNFEQGMAINHIMDPAVTGGTKETMLGPYDEYLYKKDDGVIEMVNNLSLRKFLSASPSPSRLSSWLLNGQDGYFPVTHDGTLQFNYLYKSWHKRKRGENLEYDTITSLKAYGCLFEADHIRNCATPKHQSHLGVNLHALDDYSLPEYREIRGAFKEGEGQRIKMLSEPVLLIDLDPRREYEPIVTGNQCEAVSLSHGYVDGIIYWWVINDEWSNREADLPVAACLFHRRLAVPQAKKVPFNVFLKESAFIISHGRERIFASAEDTALAAPAPPPSSPAEATMEEELSRQFVDEYERERQLPPRTTDV